MTYFNAGVRRIDKVIKRIRCSGQGSVKGIGKDNSIALCSEIRVYTAGIELLFGYINPDKKRTTYTPQVVQRSRNASRPILHGQKDSKRPNQLSMAQEAETD
jgi:hypothetical protein